MLLSPAKWTVASFPPVLQAQREYVHREPGRCAKANAVKPRCQWSVAALISPAITDGRTGHDARAGGDGYQTAASIPPYRWRLCAVHARYCARAEPGDGAHRR